MPRAFFKFQFFKSQNHVLNHLAYLHAQSPLFSGTSNIPLETAQQMVSTFDKPCKWWFVFSLNRTDADRLQIDRGYFQQLLESQKGIWAKAYNIPPERLHIYASYHDLDHHPHVHVVLHGEHPSDGYVVRRNSQSLGDAFKHCRQTVKSSIANEIFRADSETLKKDRSQQRQELNKELDKRLLEIGRSTHPVHPDIQTAMRQLSTQLSALPGKHLYGYLPPDLKLQVDNLLEEAVKKDAQLNGMFEAYKTTHRSIIDYLYVDSPITLDQKMADWENKFFHPAKGDDTRRHNIILQAAEALAPPAMEPNKKEEPQSLRPTPNNQSQRPVSDAGQNFTLQNTNLTDAEENALNCFISKIRHTAEASFQRSGTVSLGEKFLAIRNNNPCNPLPGYWKMPYSQQELVQSAVREIVSLPSVQKVLKTDKPSELRHWSDTKLLEYCTNPETSGLYRLVTGYAARATHTHPIDPLYPEIRKADYKLLCALDNVICISLNLSPEESFSRRAADDLAQRIFTRDVPEKPTQFYGQLSSTHQEEIWEMLSGYFQTNSVTSVLHERTLLEAIPNFQDYFTKNNTQFVNLVLRRLRERWETPNEPLVPQFQFSSYHSKSFTAAVRSTLYAVASTLRDDSQRHSPQLPRAGKKLRRKHIHHQTIEERREQSHDR